MSVRPSRTLAARLFTFTKRAALTALILGALGAALEWPSSVFAQQPPAHNPKAGKAVRKQLSLRNTTKDTITIELRVGDAPDCAANPPAATQTLPPGRAWLIASGRPICWRRSDVKSPAAASSWHRHVLKPGDDVKLALTS